MKVNHALIRQVIQILGISAFLVSIFFKLKAIILMGGTQSISDKITGVDDDEAKSDFDFDDEEVDEPEVSDAEVATDSKY